MKVVASADKELSVEERNLLSVAYKNVIGARRASWRIVTSIEQKEESKGNESQVALIKEYRQKIEDELAKICDDILEVLEKHLIPSAETGESKVFYHKMLVNCSRSINSWGVRSNGFVTTGRETTTATWLSLRSVTGVRIPPTSPSKPTRARPRLPRLTWHRRTPSVWDLLSTSLCSTTRFSTRLTRLASSLSKLSMMQLLVSLLLMQRPETS